MIDHVAAIAPDLVLFYDGWNDCTYYSLLDVVSRHGSSDLSRQLASRAQGVRQLEMELSISNMNEPSQALKRAWFSSMNASVSFLASAFHGSFGPRLRRSAGGRFPIGVHQAMEGLVPEVDDEQWCLSGVNASRRYLQTDALTRSFCSTHGIPFLHALQPLLLWGEKPMTNSEQEWAKSGYSTGAIAPFAAFRTSVLEVVGQPTIDLTGLFDTTTDEVYIDSGHLNRLGNYKVAHRLSKLIEVELLSAQVNFTPS